MDEEKKSLRDDEICRYAYPLRHRRETPRILFMQACTYRRTHACALWKSSSAAQEGILKKRCVALFDTT